MEKADKKDPRTVFVRGVSFDIGDAELEAAFSAVGPVRHSFLIKAGRNGKHKGFGFVQFALEEDAIRATQELNNTDLGGRKIQVESALKRAPLEERKTKRKGAAAEGDGEGEKKEPAAKKPRAAEGDEVAAEAAVQAASPKTAPARKRDPAESKAKHALVRTVAVGGLSPATMDAAIASARAHGTVELVTSPAPADLVRKYKLEQDGCFGDVVLVQYSSTKDAMAAIAALHGKEVKPGLPQGKKAKRKAQQGAVRVWARQVSGEGLHLKRWRLVVRNLSFKATEADIRAAFAPAGFIWEVTLPLSAEGKPRGFAFVGFICRSHAERAIKLVNGTAVGGRPVAVDWAVAKRDFEAGVKGQAPSAAVDSAGEEVSEDEGGSDVHGEGRAGDGRILGQEVEGDDGVELAPEAERGMLHSVIDDILGGGDDEMDGDAREDSDGAEDGADEDGDDSSLEESDNDDDEDGADSEGDSLEGDVSEDEDAMDDDSDEGVSDREGAEEAEEDGKASTRAAAVQRVEERAQRLADAIANRQTGHTPVPGASVFVRGLPIDTTKDQLFTAMRQFGFLSSCRLVMNKETGKAKGTAFVDFRTAASADAAVEACSRGRQKIGPGVIVAGRQVEVDLALDGDGARKLAAEKAGTGGQADRRHLYLAKEGVIEEGSSAWEGMSVSDRAKRKRAAEETRTKLRSPNFCVSTTRLNVRNVPRSWDEKKLKQLVIAAVKERATKAQPKVVQVKILREGAVGQEKDKDAPPGRSKGIAFVEFSEHEHALCALRQLNNNPKPWGKEHRPIVEFAIDNVKALKVREARQARSLTGGEKPEAGVPEATQGAGKGGGKAAKTAKGAEEAEVEDGGDEQPKSKRKLRQERRNMLKQRKRQEQGKKEEQREEGGGGAAKSRRRREQRKRKKEGGGVDAGAEDGVVSVAPAGKKVRKEAAPPATSAAAVPSRARAAAAEEKARGRKRQADAVVDMAASAGMAAGGKVLRKRKDKGDRLDVLVDKYKAKLDSSDGGARKGGKVVASLAAPAAKKEPSKRWFE